MITDACYRCNGHGRIITDNGVAIPCPRCATPAPDPYRVVEDALDALGWFETEKDDPAGLVDDLVEQATRAVVGALRDADLIVHAQSTENPAVCGTDPEQESDVS